MSNILKTTAAIIMLGLAAMGAAHAAPASLHEFYAAHPGYLAGLPEGYQPQQPLKPQFNNPGPQISVQRPANPVDRLPPLMGAGQPDALGIK
jgi:hypothetical protein